MSQSPTQPTKNVTIHATIQRRWDSLALADHRERMEADKEHIAGLKEYVAQHREQVELGQEVWVDCHDVTVAWIKEGCIHIGGQRYTVGPVEDGYHLRCLCAGCAMDMAYCQVNHQVRISEHFYARLRRKARAATLPDGTIVRFTCSFNLGAAGRHDTFRKGHYTHGVRKAGLTRKQTSTVFYTLDTDRPIRIVNWQDLDWEIVTPDE